MVNPLVSIIIPIFNRGRYLERCLRSVLNQETLATYNVICIDDGSTDNSADILNKYKDKIELIVNKENRGLPFSLNRGIELSTSRYIVRVDSDDYVSSHFVELLSFALLSNPNITAIACDYIEIDEEAGEKIINCQEEPIACGIMFAKDSLTSIGLYNEEFRVHEDKELRARYNTKYRIERLPIPLYRYIKHSENLTKDTVSNEHYLSLLLQNRKTMK